MRHFIAISEVDKKTMRLFKESPRKIIQHLHIDGQDGKEFLVNDFVAKWNLLTFSFVRHPFDRSVMFCLELHDRLRYIHSTFYRIISAYYNKVCNPRNTYSPLYNKFLRTYEDITWPTFAQMILDIADEEGCYIASSCDIDVHIK